LVNNTLSLTILVLLTLSGCKSCNSHGQEEQILYNCIITGIVREIGNAPHTEIVLSGISADVNEGRTTIFHLENKEHRLLNDYLFKEITVTADVKIKLLRFAGSDDGEQFYSAKINNFLPE